MTTPKHSQINYRKSLYGWLSYAFASEVFVIVSLTLFLPVALEQFARDNGYIWPEHVQPCSTDDAGRCQVNIGFAWIDTASFSMYVNSASVALQALTVISVGGIADHPPHRKRLLLAFAILGSFSALLFFFVPSTSSAWLLCAVLAMTSNVGFGASVVAMNSYLPILARAAPEVEEVVFKLSDAEEDAPLILSSDEETSADTPELHKEYETTLSRATSRISSLGIALGYGAGIILLILTLIPVTIYKGSTLSLRIAIGASGLWWAFFTVPAALLLPSNISTSVESGVVPDEPEQDWHAGRVILNAWISLGRMLHVHQIVRLRNTFIFLAAWFLLSDGFTTITSTAVLFAKTVLHMPASALVVIGVVTPLAGILGALTWPIAQRRLKWSNLRTLTTLAAAVSFIPAYGCLGFFVPSFGLKTPGEMYVLVVIFGSVYGAFQGYARALYAELLPPGEEARWYALFSITDKSSSFVGPMVVGAISQATGNIRYGFFFLVAVIWVAVPILLSIDVDQGRRDARQFSLEGGM
ncbi:MFS general substrate transporter [Fistulina hepatica ATCC 64428]|uniref:Autophagy-related protein n=1 Tax=Fistulina hepatica ATCC 64428 TaxID=1128425 RepID=A0A0D7ADV3_9AGAR|nr:MFS general substrate transporter [Fistulina hepatica ATCC 64428]